MLSRLLLLIALAPITFLLPIAASAQVRESAPGIWSRADGRVRFAAARISLPERAGTAVLIRTVEASHHGAGLDNAAQYESADRQLIATAYIYAPNLAHAGLSAYATDQFIRANADLAPRRLGSRLTTAGGQQDAAIRIDYAGYRGNRASSAAFLKVGQWVVKLRVTGPEERRTEVDQAMTALLDGLRFEGSQRARPPEPLDPGECGAARGRRATLLPSTPADALEDAVIGTVESDTQARERDGAGILTPRFGRAWCLSSRAGGGHFPILRSQMPAEGERKRSVLVVLLTDSGRLLEVVETARRDRFVLFLHEIGRSELYGAYDAIPSDEQISEILAGGNASGPVRAIVERTAEGNANIQVNTPAPALVPTT